jgi:hypothetical protein
MRLQLRTVTTLRIGSLLPSRRRAWLLLALSVAYVLSVVLALVSNGMWATRLLLANGGAAVLDWRGYWRLGYRITWRRLNAWAKLGLLLMWVLVAPAFLLYDGLHSAWRARRRALRTRPADIAQLERELGL